MNYIWIKVTLAISLDGKIAFPNNKSKPLAGKDDRRILEESLTWADATLMGSETLRIHRNTCLIHNDNLIRKRIKEGKSGQPISIIVSNNANHPKELPYFKQPVERWLMTRLNLTKEKYKDAGYMNLISLQKNWAETFNILNSKGINSLLVLGGAKLITSIMKEDKIDELQLTVTPKIIGGLDNWIPNQIENIHDNIGEDNSWLLKKSKILENNEILLKYIRNRI